MKNSRLFVLLSLLCVSMGTAGAMEAPKKVVKPVNLALNAPKLTTADVIKQNVKTYQAEGVRPSGVPYWWDWYSGANKAIGLKLEPGFLENTGYGIIHELKGSKQPNHVKAYIGPIEVWLYGSDGKWRKVIHSKVYGSNYRADFKNNESKPWKATTIMDDKVIVAEPEPDYNLHFWNYTNRGIARPDDIYVYTRYYAKAGANNALVACAGDDQYNGAKSNSMGQSNHMLLTTNWQSIVYTSAPEAILKKLPKSAF
jgi:hypothetical protein